jgi:hypothetical protein
LAWAFKPPRALGVPGFDGHYEPDSDADADAESAPAPALPSPIPTPIPISASAFGFGVGIGQCPGSSVLGGGRSDRRMFGVSERAGVVGPCSNMRALRV